MSRRGQVAAIPVTLTLATTLMLANAFMPALGTPVESRDKTAPAVGLKPAGQIVLGMVWEPVSFNPIRGIDSGSYCASSLVYEGLVKFDQKLQIAPGLAESYSVSPDGKNYQMVLRPSLKFSTGRPLTADDVKASLLLGASTFSPFRGDYKDIESVEVLDARHPHGTSIASLSASIVQIGGAESGTEGDN